MQSTSKKAGMTYSLIIFSTIIISKFLLGWSHRDREKSSVLLIELPTLSQKRSVPPRHWPFSLDQAKWGCHHRNSRLLNLSGIEVLRSLKGRRWANTMRSPHHRLMSEVESTGRGGLLDWRSFWIDIIYGVDNMLFESFSASHSSGQGPHSSTQPGTPYRFQPELSSFNCGIWDG